MEFNTGGTADSSNSGAMTGGTMDSSMYKNGGGVGNTDTDVTVKQFLIYFQKNYGYISHSLSSKQIEKFLNQPTIKRVSLQKKADYFQDYLLANGLTDDVQLMAGGGLKPIPKGNKGLPKLPKSVRNKMGYMAKGGGVEDSNKYLVRYSQTNQQVEVLEDIIPVLNKYGIKLNYGTSVGKRPQTIIFDKRYQDSILRINADGYESEYLPEYDGEEFRDASDLEDILKNSQSNEMAKGGGTKKNITTKKTKTMDKKWSKKIDKAIKAKKPGFRKSPSGGYYEYRSNRSDANPKMKLEWGGTAESSETGEPIGGENQSSMFSEGGNIGGFTYSIGGL